MMSGHDPISSSMTIGSSKTSHAQQQSIELSGLGSDVPVGPDGVTGLFTGGPGYESDVEDGDMQQLPPCSPPDRHQRNIDILMQKFLQRELHNEWILCGIKLQKSAVLNVILNLALVIFLFFTLNRSIDKAQQQNSESSRLLERSVAEASSTQQLLSNVTESRLQLLFLSSDLAALQKVIQNQSGRATTLVTDLGNAEQGVASFFARIEAVIISLQNNISTVVAASDATAGDVSALRTTIENTEAAACHVKP